MTARRNASEYSSGNQANQEEKGKKRNRSEKQSQEESLDKRLSTLWQEIKTHTQEIQASGETVYDEASGLLIEMTELIRGAIYNSEITDAEKLTILNESEERMAEIRKQMKIARRMLLDNLEQLGSGLEELKFIDINPEQILGSIIDSDRENIQNALVAQINGEPNSQENFNNLIKDILEDLKSKEEIRLTEQQIKTTAEGIKASFQQRIEQEAILREMSQGGLIQKLFKKRHLVWDALKKGGKGMALYGSIGLGIKGVFAAAAGLSLIGTGIAAGWMPVAVSGLGIAGFKLVKGFSTKKGKEAKEEEVAKAAKPRSTKEDERFKQMKLEILNEMFNGYGENFKNIFSVMLSDQLRVDSSEEARMALLAYQTAEEDHSRQANEDSYEGVKTALDGVSKELYISALKYVRAEYNFTEPKEQENMAVLMATTLWMYERRDARTISQVKQKAESQPGFVRILNKFLDLRGASKIQEQNTWGQKIGYAVGAGAVGAGISLLATQDRYIGAGLAALGGVSAGLAYADRGQQILTEQKVLRELEGIINEIEQNIGWEIELNPNDYEHEKSSEEKMEWYKERAGRVQTALKMGILQKNPDLELRGRNLILQVRKLELRNADSWNSLLDDMKNETTKQVAEAEKTMEGLKIKSGWRKWGYALGGAIVAGGLTFLAGKGTAWALEEFGGGQVAEARADSVSEREDDFGDEQENTPLEPTPEELTANLKQEHAYLSQHGGAELEVGSDGRSFEFKFTEGIPGERRNIFLFLEGLKDKFGADHVINDLDKTRLLNMAANMTRDLQAGKTIPGIDYNATEDVLVVKNLEQFIENYANEKYAHAGTILTEANYTRSGAYAYVGNIKIEHFQGLKVGGQEVRVDPTNMELVNAAREALMQANLQRYGFTQGVVDSLRYNKGRDFHEYKFDLESNGVKFNFNHVDGKMVLTEINGETLAGADRLEVALDDLEHNNVVQQLIEHQCQAYSKGTGLTPEQYQFLARAEGVKAFEGDNYVLNRNDVAKIDEAIGKVKAYASINNINDLNEVINDPTTLKKALELEEAGAAPEDGGSILISDQAVTDLTANYQHLTEGEVTEILEDLDASEINNEVRAILGSINSLQAVSGQDEYKDWMLQIAKDYNFVIKNADGEASNVDVLNQSGYKIGELTTAETGVGELVDFKTPSVFTSLANKVSIDYNNIDADGFRGAVTRLAGLNTLQIETYNRLVSEAGFESDEESRIYYILKNSGIRTNDLINNKGHLISNLDFARRVEDAIGKAPSGARYSAFYDEMVKQIDFVMRSQGIKGSPAVLVDNFNEETGGGTLGNFYTWLTSENQNAMANYHTEEVMKVVEGAGVGGGEKLTSGQMTALRGLTLEEISKINTVEEMEEHLHHEVKGWHAKKENIYSALSTNPEWGNWDKYKSLTLKDALLARYGGVPEKGVGPDFWGVKDSEDSLDSEEWRDWETAENTKEELIDEEIEEDEGDVQENSDGSDTGEIYTKDQVNFWKRLEAVYNNTALPSRVRQEAMLQIIDERSAMPGGDKEWTTSDIKFVRDGDKLMAIPSVDTDRDGKAVEVTEDNINQYLSPEHRDGPPGPDLSDNGEAGKTEGDTGLAELQEAAAEITAVPATREVEIGGEKYVLEFKPDGSFQAIKGNSRIIMLNKNKFLNDGWMEAARDAVDDGSAGSSNVALRNNTIVNRAGYVYLCEKVLESDELSPTERSSIEKWVDGTIDNTEKLYGDVFREPTEIKENVREMIEKEVMPRKSGAEDSDMGTVSEAESIITREEFIVPGAKYQVEFRADGSVMTVRPSGEVGIVNGSNWQEFLHGNYVATISGNNNVEDKIAAINDVSRQAQNFTLIEKLLGSVDLSETQKLAVKKYLLEEIAKAEWKYGDVFKE